MTCYDFNAKFPTEKVAIDYVFQARYCGVLTCPHCGAKVYHCRHCDNSFSPFSNTMLEQSSTDMRMWFYTIHFVLNGKKGISGCQLRQELGLTYKTAWRMLRLIRDEMGNVKTRETFEWFLEIDETYIWGKPRKKNGAPAEKSKRGRGTNKTPVVVVKEKGTNRVYAKVMLPDAEGKRLSGKQLYAIFDQKEEEQFVPVTVNHSLGQFSAGNGIHPNHIENFLSLVKRQWVGTHHHYRVKHMQGYVLPAEETGKTSGFLTHCWNSA